MLPYHLYLYFCLSWLGPTPPRLQLPLGISLSPCNITTLRTVTREKYGLPFAKEGINFALLMEVFLRIQSRQTQYICSPEYGTCMRRNGLHLRLQTWSQAPKPKTERGHKQVDIVTLRLKWNWSSFCAFLSHWPHITNYCIICPDSAFTTPKQSQCCLSQRFPSSSITLSRC